MRCSQCGEPNPGEALECSKCKAPLLDALADGTTGVSHPAPASTDSPTQMPVPTLIVPAPGATLRSESAPTINAPATGYEATGIIDITQGGAVTARTSPTGYEATGHIDMTGGSLSPAPQPVMRDLTPGMLFAGRYEIHALIGEGGMGRVYTARDRELDKVIALKTIRSDGGGSDEAVQRFKQELILARKVSHRNVVRIFDLGEAEGNKFFTMEFIEGQSLKALIRKRGRVPPQEAVTLARQILAALKEAHNEGIIHRDLKPQNIMVDKLGIAHLMDFGIARSVDMTGLTATGAIMGTPDYMSPEQVRGEKAGEPSDIFSFGIILYEMLTGDLPYHADDPLSKIVMRLTHKPRAPREFSTEIPKNLEDVVKKCMEVDTALRYKNVDEILADLDRGQVDRSLTLRIQRAASRSKGLVAAIAVAVLAVAGSVYWSVGRVPAGVPELPAGAVRTLAIVPFTNATGSAEMEWLRTGLPDMLVTDLSQSKYVRPVPGERVFRVLQESGLEKSARFDEKALELVAKSTHAESLLLGQFVESGGKLRLDLTLRKSGSGVSLPLKVEATTAEVFALVDQVARQVKQHLDLSPDQLKADTDRPLTEMSTASLEARKAYQAGLAQMRLGANQEAVPLFQKAAAADPKFAMAHAKLADAFLELGRTDDAKAAADRAEALSEKSALPLAERYRIHATAALVKEDTETAAKSYRELAKLYPDDPDVQMSLASALEELERLPEALAALQQVVRMSPQYGAALLSLGRVQVKSGHPEEAIRSLQDALATKQFDAEPEALGMIHSIIGVAYRETGKLDLALDSLNKSLAYRQKTGDKRGQGATLQNLATVYEYRGEVPKALAMQQKALAVYREMGNKEGESLILNAMGQTYKTSGSLDKALGVFRESLQIEMDRNNDLQMANRLDQIADMYRLKGQYDDALIYLEQAKTHVAKTQDKKEAGINLEYVGLVRKAQGNYNEALEAFLAALPLYTEIKHEMSVADVHLSVGDIYESQGRYADAYTAFQQSLDIYTKLKVEHDIAHCRWALGRLYLTLGRLDEAEKDLHEAEHLGHETHAAGQAPAILLGQARLLVLRGKPDQAVTALEQASAKATASGQKEVGVEARVALGRIYLAQGKLPAADLLLRRARDEAQKARLRPLEAEGGIALARVLLAKGDAEGARRAAQDAATLAEKYAGRPALEAALAVKGMALEKLGKTDEAVDALAKAASTLEWIRGSLRPEDVETYMAQADVQAFLKEVLPRLEKGGRTAEAAPLGRWLKAGA